MATATATAAPSIPIYLKNRLKKEHPPSPEDVLDA
jgi:hypothetical protein